MNLKKKLKTTKDRFFRGVRIIQRRYLGWIACATVAIIVWIILHFIYPITSEENVRFLLSAISQSLAAIFALVFSITLIVTQITRSYTAISKMFKSGTIVLMIIFAIGIVFPLVILKTGTNYINESIAIAIFCILSVIPHWKETNTTLKFEVGLKDLADEAFEAIDLKHETKAKNKILEIRDMAEDALNELRIESVNLAIHFLLDIGMSSIRNKLDRTTTMIVVILGEEGGLIIKNKDIKISESNHILFIMAQVMGRIGTIAVRFDLLRSAKWSAHSLAKLQKEREKPVVDGLSPIESGIKRGALGDPSHDLDAWKKFKKLHQKMLKDIETIFFGPPEDLLW